MSPLGRSAENLRVEELDLGRIRLDVRRKGVTRVRQE